MADCFDLQRVTTTIEILADDLQALQVTCRNAFEQSSHLQLEFLRLATRWEDVAAWMLSPQSDGTPRVVGSTEPTITCARLGISIASFAFHELGTRKLTLDQESLFLSVYCRYGEDRVNSLMEDCHQNGLRHLQALLCEELRKVEQIPVSQITVLRGEQIALDNAYGDTLWEEEAELDDTDLSEMEFGDDGDCVWEDWLGGDEYLGGDSWMTKNGEIYQKCNGVCYSDCPIKLSEGKGTPTFSYVWPVLVALMIVLMLIVHFVPSPFEMTRENSDESSPFDGMILLATALLAPSVPFLLLIVAHVACSGIDRLRGVELAVWSQPWESAASTYDRNDQEHDTSYEPSFEEPPQVNYGESGPGY